MIIIGTFFLLFAYNVVSKYYENEEAKFRIEVGNEIRTILNNVGRTAGVEDNSIESLKNIFQDSRIKIICEEGIPILSINDYMDPNNQYLKNYPTFMTYIEQEKIDYTYLAVESFAIPFKTTNTLAIISKKNKIIFDNESEITKRFIKKFRDSSYEKMNYEVAKFNNLDGVIQKANDENLNSIVFVSDKGVSPSIDLNEIDYLAINVQIEDNKDYGTIIYKDSNIEDFTEKEFSYIDFDKSMNMMTMAIFSHPNTFECSYDLILDSTLSIFEFYIQKTNHLIELSKTKKICSTRYVSYGTSGTSFDGREQTMKYNTVKTALEDIYDSLKNNGFENPSSGLIDGLIAINQSQQQLREADCIYLY